jgi:NitT/TauT family transport system substrate-binding protein
MGWHGSPNTGSHIWRLVDPMKRACFHRPGVRLTLLIASLLVVLLPLAGCGGTASGSAGGTGKSLAPLTVGLTYVPNIQFAPFYVADALGYYRAVGLNVTFHHHGANEDEFGALLAGREDAIFAGGDETLQARSAGAPLVYVANVFRKYPITLIVPANSPIKTAVDLRGHSVGIPGRYGADYTGLLALLYSAHLTQSDVHIQSIGYTQVPALLSHRVDAVMGYINNEPLQLRKAGFPIRTIDVSSVQPLVSDGLAATQRELQTHPEQIKALIAATLRGVQYVIAHPQEAVNLSEKYVPGLDEPTNAANALAVLQATIPLWQGGTAKPGYTDPAAWQSMANFLQSEKLLSGPVNANQAYSNAYLPS